jgi:hypothetical protein
MIKLMVSAPSLKTSGVEVDEHLLARGIEGSAEPSNLRDQRRKPAITFSASRRPSVVAW